MLVVVIFLNLAMRASQHVISTAQGPVRGVVHDGYVAYSGIPYATVVTPMGRFKSAGLAPTWSNIRESRTSTCSSLSTSEECLQLDVYVPTAEGNNWPVLLWVTGGSGPYYPGHLVRQGIITIIVYHRLGPQGFLCLGDEAIPGNAGVKDVVLALRWVRDNIVAFSGNPAKVVAAGQSFGAAMVHSVLLSSIASGLLHGAILQSGTALSAWTFNYDAEERAEAVSDNSGESNEELVKSLLDMKIEDLVKRSLELRVPYIPLAMCVEKPLKKEEILLAEAPYDLITNKKGLAVPMMIGYNSNEAYVFLSVLREAGSLRRISTTPTFLLPNELKFSNSREKDQVARQIADVYFKNNVTMYSILGYHSDAYFSNHIHRAVYHHASTSPVFYYQFSYTGEAGVLSEPGVVKTGAAHSDELAYLFNDIQLDGEDGTVQRHLVKLWTNFVKHLNPTPPHSEVTWEQTTPDNPRLLDITTELKMIDYPHKKTTRLWDDIYYKYYYIKQRIYSSKGF